MISLLISSEILSEKINKSSKKRRNIHCLVGSKCDLIIIHSVNLIKYDEIYSPKIWIDTKYLVNDRQSMWKFTNRRVGIK